QTAWWFTPRLAVSTAAQPVLERPQAEPAPAPAPVAAPMASAPVSADLLRAAPMGIALADKDGVLAQANPAFAQFFGRADLTGQSLTAVIDEADRAPVAALIAGAGTPG